MQVLPRLASTLELTFMGTTQPRIFRSSTVKFRLTPTWSLIDRVSPPINCITNVSEPAGRLGESLYRSFHSRGINSAGPQERCIRLVRQVWIERIIWFPLWTSIKTTRARKSRLIFWALSCSCFTHPRPPKLTTPLNHHLWLHKLHIMRFGIDCSLISRLANEMSELINKSTC
jgi:hypothetical protein